MDWIFLAADAVTAVPDAPVDAWWKTGAVALGGMLLMKAFSWISGWIDGKGKEWIHERFTALQEKLNANALLGQIQADDALLKILEASIPEVFLELSETAQNDLKDGRFDVVNWQDIGKRLWERVRPHVEGGKNNYLKESSFSDGQTVAAFVVQRWFKRKEAEKKGLTK